MENGGRTTVPSNYEPNKQLSIWIKRQRRQYKFMMDDNGKNHTMTPYRLKRLNSVNFSWDGRKRERGGVAGRDDCTVLYTKVNKKAKLVKEPPKTNLRRSRPNTNEMKKPARILPYKPATTVASKAVVPKSNIPIMAFSAHNDDTIVLNANEDEKIDKYVLNTDDDEDDNDDGNEDDEDVPNSNDDDDHDHADGVYDDVLSTDNDYDDADTNNHNDEKDDDDDSIVI